MANNKKVSSEKGTDKKKKTVTKQVTEKKEVEENLTFVNPDVVPETMEDMERRADVEAARAREAIAKKELEELKEQVRMLLEANAAKEEENKRLLALSERVLDTTEPSNKKSGSDRTIAVKCLELNGVELSSPNRDTIIALPYDTWVDCSEDELAYIFKKISNRTLFEDGICVMAKEGYDLFKIKQKIFIDIDKIVDVLNNGSEHEIVSTFNSLTNNKKKPSVSHLILYAIVGKSLDGELPRLPRTAIETMEMYFGVRFRDAETLLTMFRQIKE